MENPDTSRNMMWVLMIIVMSIAIIRGDITLNWFGFGS
jgi:hypothetical protein